MIIDTYPDFRIDLNKVAAAITPRTKLILLNSPANPTGVDRQRGRNPRPGASWRPSRTSCCSPTKSTAPSATTSRSFRPAKYNDRTLVIDGFTKSHGMTGWRLGFVHGPAEIIDTMIKLQQYTFVCAPQPVQWAGAVAMDVRRCAATSRTTGGNAT